MFCTNCGKELREGAAFCTNCGKPVSSVHKENAADSAEKADEPTADKAKSDKPQSDKLRSDKPQSDKSQSDKSISDKPKSGKTGLLAAGIILVIAVVAVGILLFFHFRNGNEDNDSGRDRNPQSREEERGQEPEDSGAEAGSSADDDEVRSETAESGTTGIDLDAGEYREVSIQDIMAALDAYQQYIDQAGFSDTWGEDYYGCELIYLDNDNLPELIIYGVYEAAGNIVLTYDGSQVHDLYLGRLYFDYMERMNRLCNSGGHMGYYFDIVYCIKDGMMTQIGEGIYQEVYDDQNNIITDEEGGLIYEYTWNGQEVTYDEYMQALNEVYPQEQYPVTQPPYSPYFSTGGAYTSVYDAYYAGIGNLTHILAWMINPLEEINNMSNVEFCSSFMLMSLTYIEAIAEYYPNAYMSEYWIYISEDDVRDYLTHSIGRNDISQLIEYAFKDPDNLQAYTNYLDGTFVMTTPDSGDYWIGDPKIDTVQWLSDVELQVSGTIEGYVTSDSNTTFFTVRVTPDSSSVWGYRLLGIDRWDTYLAPYADSQLLTEEDVRDWSEEQLRLARNEIYARHGRIFTDEQLQRFFESRNWYHGTVAAEDFNDSVLNEYEIANRDFIVQYESDMGYR